MTTSWITLCWVAMCWVGIGILLIESGFRKFPEHRQRSNYRLIALGVICFWPPLLIFVLWRRAFKK